MQLTDMHASTDRMKIDICFSDYDESFQINFTTLCYA